MQTTKTNNFATTEGWRGCLRSNVPARGRVAGGSATGRPIHSFLSGARGTLLQWGHATARLTPSDQLQVLSADCV